MDGLARTVTEFNVSLFREHLEEASFLFEKRMAMLHDPEFSWVDMHGPEQRLEAHLDALHLGGDLALDIGRRRILDGDFGEFHAATRVLCRQDRYEEVFALLMELDREDDEKKQAFWDALRADLPTGCERPLLDKSMEKGQGFPALALELLGYRRFSLLDKSDVHRLRAAGLPLRNIIQYLGKIRDSQHQEAIYHKGLPTDDEALAQASALALLRMGDRRVIPFLSIMAKDRPWARVLLGLGGSRAAHRELLRIGGIATSPEVLQALGLAGLPEAVDILLGGLEDPGSAEPSAQALYLISGAVLKKEMEIPVLPEDDEGASEGQGADSPGTEMRLSQNASDWEAWWKENKNRFKPGFRYRLGKPYSPAALLETLESPECPQRIRQLAAEEWVIRYGADFGLETDMTVRRQRKILEEHAQWSLKEGGRFHPGRWHFAGLAQD